MVAGQWELLRVGVRAEWAAGWDLGREIGEGDFWGIGGLIS